MRYLVVILWIPTVHLMDPHPAEVMLMVMKLVGEIFGIVAGTLGIFLTRTNNDERMKCLWKAFIALVGRFFFHLSLRQRVHHQIIIQCVLTTICCFVGFWIVLVWSLALSDDVRDCETSYSSYSYSYRRSKSCETDKQKIILLRLLTVKLLLFFGKSLCDLLRGVKTLIR